MTQTQYKNGLRLFLNDFSNKNRIIKFEQENTDDALDLYLEMALGALVNIPPAVVQWGFDDFPIPALLIHQSAIECLMSNTILQSRNEIQYNNGGISVKFPDGGRYMNALNPLYRVLEMELKALVGIKVNANIDQSWGGVSSPYVFIAGYPYLIRPYSGLGGEIS